MLVGVSSSGNVWCGVMSPRLAVRANHSSMYDVRRAMQGTVNHQKSINVWGCFSWKGVGDLHWVKGILTGPEYRKILIHHMVPSANRLNPEGFIFQQDNDPKHTSNVVKKYLQNKKIEVMNWPAQKCLTLHV